MILHIYSTILSTYHSHIVNCVCNARDGSMQWLILWVHLTAPQDDKIKGYFQVCLGGVLFWDEINV